MAKWDNINGIIENAIKSNNAQSITGDSLQSVLKSIVSDVGANATFAGIAIASTSPGSYDGPVFYIAASAGTYAGFGSIVVNAGELAVLYNSANGNGWSKSSIGLSSIVDKSITKAKLASDVPIDAMQNKITQLETSVNTVVGEGATEAIENFAEILAFLNGITDTTTLEGLLTNLKTEIDGKLSNKVDKVSGKGLSTNDYTTTEKNKLAGIAADANNYSHPAYTARTGVPAADAKPGFGGTFQVSQPVSDGQGHITAVNTRTVTIPNAAATTSAAGLMSSTDKTKLDGVESGAQKNTVTGIKGNAESSYRTGNVNLTPANIGAAAASHTHTIANVTNLQSTLDGKAAASHTHAISNITNLQATLDGKAAKSHTHSASEITDFTTKVKTLQAADTLSTKPTESTTTHTVNGVSVAYQIGEMVRVADASSNTGYKFYILHDILNGKAVWGESTSDYIETVKVTVTADDGTSVAGIVITINGIDYTLDSTGVVSVKIAYGVQYSISAGEKKGYTTPSGSTFTAGQAARNVSLVYKKITLGTFIEDVNGNLYTRSEWGSSSHGTANAVVVLTDACKVRLALTQASDAMAMHSSYNGTLENYMTAISDETQAKADYNGAANTTNIMKLQSSTSYAAGWCNAFTFPNGTKGCLPSLGQLWTLYQNKTEVDACLSACGGTAMTNNYYWSSTFWGIDGQYRCCWNFGWSGNASNNYLHYGDYVRAVSAY